MTEQALNPTAAAYTLNGAPVARERFYELACDPQRSVVVEACAGAGKTWMLVSRILRALLEGAQPQDIVAITFTRKAAGEMRARLSEWLHEFAHCDDAGRLEALIQRGIAPDQAAILVAPLQSLQQRLLQGGRQVEIRTFHAWFSQLLRAAPLELLEAQGIAPELQLLEDESELMPELWQRFHTAVLADAALLAAYQDLVLSQGRGRLLSWLESAFSKRVEIRLAQQAGRLEESLPEAAGVAPEFAGLEHPLQAFAALRGELAALAVALGQAKNATPKKAAGAVEQALTLADEAAAFEAVWEALFTASGTPRKNLGDTPALSAVLDQLERLRRALDQHEARGWHLQMSALALCLLDEFERLKRQRGLVDMNDLERGALALLSDAPLAGWVQERLDSQVRHLLIDEFQDTSPLQWHALYAWLAGYVGAGGGASGQRPPSVFIVGDPKQSIYRFRRAEPRVFAAARDFVREGLAGVLLACDHTRRNAPPVLAAVNAAFDAASRAQEYSGFRAHTTESGAPTPLDGVFFIEATDDADTEEGGDSEDDEAWRPSLSRARHEPELHRRAAEAQRIAACVADLLAGGQVLPGEIFVLARKRDGLRVLAQTLKALGLPHVAPEEQLLLDSPDVRDLLALLDALASPGHNLSLAHALRSPLFGADEADLLQLATLAGNVDWLGHARAAEAPRLAWWAALMLAAEQDLSPALQRARSLLARWAELAGARSPHDLLDAIIFEGELMARLAAVAPASERRARLHAVDALLALALDLDGGRYAGLYGFVRALKNRALSLAAPAEPEAVQLLTVHGAKGLEAKVVFLMDCEAGPARAESSSLAVAWPVQEAAPAVVAFLASESRPPPSLRALLDDEREQRQREELNALYVAMTRARSRLVLSRTQGKRAPSAATWWSRLQPLAQAWPLPALAQPDPAAATASVLLKQLPQLPALPAVQATAAEMGQGPAVVDDSAALGEALHRVLEWHSGPQGAAQPLTGLLAAAAQMYGLDAKRSERLQRSAQAILASTDCAPFFDAANLLWAGNEVAVSWRGQDMRLDRLVCRREAGTEKPTWWVLDYKLNPAPQQLPEYLQQLWRYREAVRQLQPGEPVRTAFITGQGRLIDCTAQIDAHAIPETL